MLAWLFTAANLPRHYIYIYIERERETGGGGGGREGGRERERKRERERDARKNALEITKLQPERWKLTGCHSRHSGVKVNGFSQAIRLTLIYVDVILYFSIRFYTQRGDVDLQVCQSALNNEVTKLEEDREEKKMN